MADPRVDLGQQGVVRGDPFSWTLTITALDVNGQAQPVNLTAFGSTWAAKARATPDAATAYTFTIDASAAATGVLVLSLSAATTTSMNTGVFVFDLEVSGGSTTPITPFKGSIAVFKDTTHA